MPCALSEITTRPMMTTALRGGYGPDGLADRVALRRAGCLRVDVGQLVLVIGALHACHDQSLDLGRALEDLVDLRVPEELLERAVHRLRVGADQVHQGGRGP